jgi:small nuclear ribonucleoprotein (snRNP)-like protein
VQAYDGHLNMVLSDVEETVTIVEVDEENEDEAVRVSTPNRAAHTLRSMSFQGRAND